MTQDEHDVRNDLTFNDTDIYRYIAAGMDRLVYVARSQILRLCGEPA